MKTLLIIGAGEYGQLVKEIAVNCGYEKIDFLDDNSSLAIGKVNEYIKFASIYKDIVVAIGNPIVRRKVIEQVETTFHLTTLIHPTATISMSAEIQNGSVIEAQAVISTEATIGKSCFINAGAVVNHNSTVNDYCQIDCNAVVAARANVPEYTKVTSCTVWSEK